MDVQDTARLSALGIPRTGDLLNIAVSPTAPVFHIAVLHLQCTTAPIAGPIFHLFLAGQPLLGTGSPIPTATNGFFSLSKVEAGAWLHATAVDAAFEARIGSPFTTAGVGSGDLVQRARGLGFSVEECRSLLSLYEDQGRASADVKQLAEARLADIDRKIEALHGMRASLASLVKSCHGDARPDCPILDDLAGEAAER